MKKHMARSSALILRLVCILAFILVYFDHVPPGWSQAKPPTLFKAVVSGVFYPAEKKQLEQKIDTLLKETEVKASKGSVPVGLIVPHGAYEHSGKVAAAAYRQIAGKPYKSIILLGHSHYGPLQGVSVYPYGAWETPLGKVAIDDQLAATLMEQCSFVRYQPSAFEREHSLEVQLPFLQKVLENFKILPLLVGKLNGTESRALAEYLSARIEQNPGKVLVIASSDMSHYHPYHEATAMDKAVLKQIEAVDLRMLRKELESGTGELCGSPPVTTLMRVAENIGAKVKLLDYANSGDLTGDKSRVVGYAAVGL